MPSQSQKMHSVSPKERLDRAAFVVAFGFGIFGGILLKVLGAHPFVAAGYAAFILCLYAIVAWSGGRVRIEPETIGDNCYYLGFLFTLASLAFTLYQMADPSTTESSPVNIPDVISGFGVALSSTIVGVFLRVFMMQLRPDFVAKDREVRADINKSYAEFKKNMSGILVQMKSFSTESIQQASERDERIRTYTEQFVKDQHDALNDTANSISKAMEKAFADAAKRAVLDIAESFKEGNAQTTESTIELAKSIKELKKQLKENEAQSSEDIRSKRKLFVKELEEAEHRLKEHNAAMEAYLKTTRRAADAMSKKIVPALDSFGERLDKLPETGNSFAHDRQNPNGEKRWWSWRAKKHEN